MRNKIDLNRNSEGSQEYSLFDSFSLTLVLTGLIGVVLLSLNRFHSHATLILALILTTLLLMRSERRGFTLKNHFPDTKKVFNITFLILLGVLFRNEPANYISGGQDQGVYLNIAAHLNRHGTLFTNDSVRSRIYDPSLRKYYDRHNQFDAESSTTKIHQPGVYIHDLDKSKYIFQFFPLHSIGMAIASYYLGPEKSAYSLTLFSILTIILVYLLILQLTGNNHRAALLGGAWLALNPAHLYFSTFPVSEITSLAFALLALYYLNKFYLNIRSVEQSPLHLWISAGSWGALFFTRISGVIYFIFLFALLFIFILYRRELPSQLHRPLKFYFSGVTALFLLSLLFGFKLSYPYTSFHYQLIFQKFLGSELSQAFLLTVAVAMALLFLAIYLSRARVASTWLKNVKKQSNRFLLLLWLLVVVATCLKIYQVGFIEQPHTNPRWDISGREFTTIKYSALYNFFQYLGYGGAILFLVSLFMVVKRDIHPPRSALLFLTILGWLYGIFTITFIPYHLYYVRYMLSEVIPYAIILIAVGYDIISRDKRKYLSAIFLIISILSLAHHLHHSLHLFKEREHENGSKSLEKLTSQIGQDDLLFIVGQPPENKFYEIRLPLDYYFGLNTFALATAADLKGAHFNHFYDLIANFDNSYLLSFAPLESNSLPLTTVAVTTFKQKYLNRLALDLPTSFSVDKTRLYLYRIDLKQLETIYLNGVTELIPSALNANRSGFFENGIDTLECGELQGPKIRFSGRRSELIIHTSSAHPYLHDEKKLNLRVYLNGELQKESYYNNSQFNLKLNRNYSIFNSIRICSKPFTLKSLGMGDDETTRGVAVKKIIFR